MKQFTSAKKWLGDVDAQSAAKLLTAAADVALIISPTEPYIVKDVAFGSDEVANEVSNDWIGRPWSELVAVESRVKVAELLRDAVADAPPRWRHINHLSSSPDVLPILYSVTRIGPKGRIVAVGRSLRPVTTLQQRLLATQQTMDREYSRLRMAETRHRLLFQVSEEAVLVVDANTRKVVEANPAAGRMLDQAPAAMVGHLITERFDASSRRALEALLTSVRATGRNSDLRLRRGEVLPPLHLSVSLFREDRDSYFLVRLSPDATAGLNGSVRGRTSRVLEVVERSPDGFIVTGMDGRIEFANRAFLDMVQLATPEQVRGEPLDRWLGRPGVDFNLLTAHLREDQSIRLFAKALRSEYGSTLDVEICAVAGPDGEHPCLGFTIRNVAQRVTAERTAARQRPRSVEQLTELVGRVPLKELVRDSSDMIERLCIEAALELTSDNRAAAAEILGLSRQSLYAKLRRYGLGDLVPHDGTGRDAGH